MRTLKGRHLGERTVTERTVTLHDIENGAEDALDELGEVVDLDVWAVALAALLPEWFPPEAVPAQPSAHLPGTREREADLIARAARLERTDHPDDAVCPDGRACLLKTSPNGVKDQRGSKKNETFHRQYGLVLQGAERSELPECKHYNESSKTLPR